MNENFSTNNDESVPLDRREIRQARREARRTLRAETSGVGRLVMGGILLLLGIALLVQNVWAFSVPLHNWWALFILIPAVAAIERGVRTYRQAGSQLNRQAGGDLFVGLILVLVTAIFILDLGWTIWGPALMIITGLGILVTPLLHQES